MKKEKKYTEVFFSSYIDDLNGNNEWISETLNDADIDEQELSRRGSALADRLLIQMKIKAAKEKKQGLLIRALKLLQNINDNLSELNPSERLYNLLTNTSNPSFTFNSLKDFSNEDVLQMLSEIELLDLIEELEKKKE